VSTDVIIVNYNAGSLLSDCVVSTLSEGAHHVWVVDNGSTDQSLDHLMNCVTDERLSITKNGKNLGFAAACNIGARASNADTLLFLNPDSALSEGSLSHMLKVLESEPRIGMVGALLCNPDGSEQPGGRRDMPTPGRAFIRAFGMARLGRWLPSVFPDFMLHTQALPDQPIPVEAISGACMLVKRGALEDVGLWDEGYFLHCEDLDWCMRFRLKGWKIVFVPGARVVHAQGTCSRSRPFFVEWHKHQGMLRFYGKFYRGRYPWTLWWLVVLGVWLRLGLVSLRLAVQRTLKTRGVVRA
jgi:GT2 family glycosyltransferase